MDTLITVVHITACIVLVLTVLLQHGKGADIGAAFGAGASNTVFGARGAGNFLTKLTTGTVVVFMLTSLSLSYFRGSGSISELAPGVQPAPEVIEEISPGETEPATGDVPSGFEAIDPAGEAEPAPPAEGAAPSPPAEDVPPGE